VYGHGSTLPVREDAPLRPRNGHGSTKAEAPVGVAADQGLHAAVLRLANVYGAPWDHPDRLIPAFVLAAAAGNPLEVRGEGRSLDLLHLRDAAGAFVAAASRFASGWCGTSPINVCSGIEVPLAWLADEVVRIARARSVVLRVPPQHHEVDRFGGNNAAARAALAWSPSVPLGEGLAELVDSLSTAPIPQLREAPR
jgi:UDP-glucose 4-epimerase